MANAENQATGNPNEEKGIQTEQSKTGVSASPPADSSSSSKEESIPLPPISSAPAGPDALQTRYQRSMRSRDLILLGLLFLLAFALASRPVRNSDHLMHLATGRAVIQGEASFGDAPFTHTSENVYWTNHSWLYDVVSYLLHSVIGSVGLLVLKALAIVALAWILVRTGQGLMSPWVAVMGAIIAVLAMAERLLLQPTYLSMLFVGLTFYFLRRGSHLLYKAGEETETARSQQKRVSAETVTLKSYWPLLVLFVFWSNLDEWFFLGPLMVMLFLAGQFIQKSFSRAPGAPGEPRRGELRSLSLLLVLGLLACLINPHHIHVFELPTILWGRGAESVQKDSSLDLLFLSPLTGQYFRSFGFSVVGLAYIFLVILGTLSFALNMSNWRWSRFFLFAAFLILSLLRYRLIPFFAIVGGPIMALNFQEIYLASFQRSSRQATELPPWSPGGRVITVMILVILLIATWPGWIHAQPYYQRRVAWAIEIDPSLKMAAERIQELSSKGVIQKDERWFNSSPEIANAMAWYCPEQKTFFDYRFGAFIHSMKDYQEIRDGLLGIMRPSQQERDWIEDPDQARIWRNGLSNRKVQHIALYDRRTGALAQSAFKFFRKPESWAILYLDGHTILFASTATGSEELKEGRVTLQQMAYRPEPDRRAPEAGLASRPRERPFWEDLWKSPQIRPLDTAEADLFDRQFQVWGLPTQFQNLDQWFATQATSLVGSFAPTSSPTLSLIPTQLRMADLQAPNAQSSKEPPTLLQQMGLQIRQSGLMLRDDAPSYLLLPGIRAARRALAVNPNHATSHLVLGDLYLKLKNNTRERVWSAALPNLRQLRFIQAVAGATQAIAINPKNREAHSLLAEIYRQQGYMDLQVQHYEKEVELRRREGKRPDEKQEDFEKTLAQAQKRLQSMKEGLNRLTQAFKSRARTLTKPLPKAQSALQEHGLAEEALSILLKQDVSAFGREGAELELRLFLGTGRLFEPVWREMDDKMEKSLGTFTFYELRSLHALALGRYKEADDFLARLQETALSNLGALNGLLQTGLIERPKDPKPFSAVKASVIGMTKVVMDGASPLTLGFNPVKLQQRTSCLKLYLDGIDLIRREAQLAVERALMRLEAGDYEKARELLEHALSRREQGIEFPSSPVAEEVLRAMDNARSTP